MNTLQDFFEQGRQQALQEAEEAAPRMRMAVEEALRAQRLAKANAGAGARANAGSNAEAKAGAWTGVGAETRAGVKTWAWALGGVAGAVAVAMVVAWVAVGSAQMGAWLGSIGAWAMGMCAALGAWLAPVGAWFAPVGAAFASLGTAFTGLGTWLAQAVHNAGLHLQPLRDWMQALPFVSQSGLRYAFFLAVGTAILVGLDAAFRRSLRKPGTSA